jgi:hypothetical protein
MRVWGAASMALHADSALDEAGPSPRPGPVRKRSCPQQAVQFKLADMKNRRRPCVR